MIDKRGHVVFILVNYFLSSKQAKAESPFYGARGATAIEISQINEFF
jgi:hypothetical protein